MKTMVNGNSIAVILGGCGVFQKRVKQLFLDQGINPDDLPEWVDLESQVKVFKELEKSIGTNLAVEIGKYVPIKADFPPQLDTFEKALSTLDMAYKMNHKDYDDNLGDYKAVPEGDNKYRVFCNTPPYSAYYNLGILKGLAQRFDTFVQIDEIHHNNGGEFLVHIL